MIVGKDAVRDVDALLGCYTRASCQGIQSNSLPKEDLSNGTSDGGAVFDRLEGLSFTDVPFDSNLGSALKLLEKVDMYMQRKYGEEED